MCVSLFARQVITWIHELWGDEAGITQSTMGNTAVYLNNDPNGFFGVFLLSKAFKVNEVILIFFPWTDVKQSDLSRDAAFMLHTNKLKPSTNTEAKIQGVFVSWLSDWKTTGSVLLRHLSSTSKRLLVASLASKWSQNCSHGLTSTRSRIPLKLFTCDYTTPPAALHLLLFLCHCESISSREQHLFEPFLKKTNKTTTLF